MPDHIDLAKEYLGAGDPARAQAAALIAIAEELHWANGRNDETVDFGPSVNGRGVPPDGLPDPGSTRLTGEAQDQLLMLALKAKIPAKELLAFLGVGNVAEVPATWSNWLRLSLEERPGVPAIDTAAVLQSLKVKRFRDLAPEVVARMTRHLLMKKIDDLSAELNYPPAAWKARLTTLFGTADPSQMTGVQLEQLEARLVKAAADRRAAAPAG